MKLKNHGTAPLAPQMPRALRSAKGFTLIELVLVITILGILAVAALPAFINVSTQARQSSMAGVVGSVRSGIALYRSNDLVVNGPPGNYPATLDAVAASTAASAAAPMFTTVLQQGVSDATWVKGGTANIYTFSDGTSTYTYTYTSATGAFTSPTGP